MDYVRGNYREVKEIQNKTKDPDHIWSVHIVRYMKFVLKGQNEFNSNFFNHRL